MSGGKRAKAFPVVGIAEGVAILDAIRARGGWAAYALTRNGLRATRFARRTKQEALRSLMGDRRLEGFVLEKARRETVGPWRRIIIPAVELRDVDLSSVPLDENGWTDFTRRVYRRVRRIPRGQTLTYGEVAREVGSPGAARAVGQVMAKNCVAPFVPCHRVVAGGGKLGGFSAPGGVKTKAEMLERERGERTRARRGEIASRPR